MRFSLAERLTCAKSNVTQLVDRLEADGLVRRKLDPSDRRSRLAIVAIVLGLLLVTERPAAAQEASAAGLDAEGPPPPVPPEVIARDNQGRATVRAVRLETPITVDGRLDETVYETVKSVSGFYQMVPRKGEPASDVTEVWLMFDDDQVYFSARCWEEDPTRIIANEMRRDSRNIIQADYIGFILDTFHDRRSGVLINISAVGGRRDGLVSDESQFNADWNGVFESATGRFDGGWTVEVAVPFKTLRYAPGREQTWGFNVHRGQRWKNERTYLMPMPGLVSPGALVQLSLAATVVGIEAPPAATNLEVKPYVIFDANTPDPAAPTDLNGDVGVDVKYGISQNLTADFTYNTDFAQAEADEQQINLTRFSLFFPEKREFFLENAGLFSFGGGGTGPFGPSGETPVLFYSRRIGLNGGQVVPLDLGGRLTGRVGPFSVGALNIRTGRDTASAASATNFTVLRVKRDVLRRSSIGAIFTGRSVGSGGVGTNQAYGVDGAFAFFTNVTLNAYWAQTRTSGSTADATSYRVQFNYDADRYGVQLERLLVDDRFNPEVGFVRRRDMRRSRGQFRFSPRTVSHPTIRRLSWTGAVDYIESTGGRLETRERRGDFSLEFHSGDSLGMAYTNSFEFVPQPFRIASDVTVPVGGYDFNNVRLQYGFGQQRVLSGTIAAEYGTFFGGTKSTVAVSSALASLTSQLSIAPGMSINRVELPAQSVTSRLLTTRVTYTMTPLMFVSALVQYNSATDGVSTNVRLRWEYLPGSELFVVYNEERDARDRGFPGFENRAFIVKVNRLLRF